VNTVIDISPSEHLDPATQMDYVVLANHQRDEGWNGPELIADLQAWAAKFIPKCELDIAEILVHRSAADASIRPFSGGHNGFGLRGEDRHQIWQSTAGRTGKKFWNFLSHALPTSCRQKS
jgi:hypothetical protein